MLFIYLINCCLPASPNCGLPTAGIDLSPNMVAVGRYLQRQRNAERAAAGQQPEQLRFVHGEGGSRATWWGHRWAWGQPAEGFGAARGGGQLQVGCNLAWSLHSCPDLPVCALLLLLVGQHELTLLHHANAAGAGEDTRLPDGCMDLVSIMLVRMLLHMLWRLQQRNAHTAVAPSAGTTAPVHFEVSHAPVWGHLLIQFS